MSSGTVGHEIQTFGFERTDAGAAAASMFLAALTFFLVCLHPSCCSSSISTLAALFVCRVEVWGGWGEKEEEERRTVGRQASVGLIVK